MAQDKNPHDPKVSPGLYAKWQLNDGPHVDVLVNKKKKPTDPEHVKLGSLNGAEWWAKAGETFRAPLEIARRAQEASVCTIISEPGPKEPATAAAASEE